MAQLYSVINNTSLQHHGILGQKWGVRRFQNPDGTLTEEGKNRYSTMDSEKLRKSLMKKINKERHRYNLSKAYPSHYSPIGPESQKNLDKYFKDKKENESNADYVDFIRKLDRAKTDNAVNKIREDYFKTDSGKNSLKLSTVRIRRRDGRWEFGKEYANSYGKDITIAYLKDLGYDKDGAEFIARILAKDNMSLL